MIIGQVFGLICDVVDDHCDPYSIDFKEAVLTQMAATSKDSMMVDTDPWSIFLQSIRLRLRICISLDPRCSSYSRRLRNFPKFMNRFSVVWTDSWPEISYSDCCKQTLLADGWDVRESGVMANFLSKGYILATSFTSRAQLAIARRQNFNMRRFFAALSLFKEIYADNSTFHRVYSDRLQLGLTRLKLAESDTLMIQESMISIAEDAKEKLATADELRMKLLEDSSLLETETDKLEALNRKIGSYELDIFRKREVARKALLAGNPHLDVMKGALGMVGRADLGELSALSTPLEGVEDVFAALTVLMAGRLTHIPTQKSGRVREKDRSWDKVRKTLLANINALLTELESFQYSVEAGSLHRINLREVRQYLLLDHFKPEVIERRSEVAGAICAWIISAVRYWDIVESIEPLRHEIDFLHSGLQAKLDERRELNETIATLSSRKDKTEQRFTEASAVSSEAGRLAENCELRLDLAKRLISALEVERDDWQLKLETLAQEENCTVGTSDNESLLLMHTRAAIAPFPHYFFPSRVECRRNNADPTTTSCIRF